MRARTALPGQARPLSPPSPQGGEREIPAAAEAAANVAAPASPSATSLPPGTSFGAFRIDALLGRGSVGAVYRAIDGRNGQVVALKVLALHPAPAGAWGESSNDAGAAAESRAQFFRETESARRLQHPACVALIEAGETDVGPTDAGGRPGLAWMAMALAPGHDLRRHTQAHALLAPATVLDIGARVAEALAHAHRSGVVHRDVKPANIIFDAATGAVALTDFGVARIAETSAAASVAATRSGALLGTVSFMPPEQLAGARVEAASDLYSLGVTLFVLLTGKLPHPAGSMSRQMRAISHDPAPDLRSLRPELGAALAGTLARLLAKTPTERGADGDALAAELRAIAALWAQADTARAREAAPLPNSGALPAAPGKAPADPRHNSGD